MPRVVVAELYRDGRERLLALGAELGAADAARPVPACPDWTVKDLYAHLAGVAADVLARRLDGMMTGPWTARKVQERASASLAEVCAEWVASGPRLEARLGGGGRDELVIDVTSHEHDVRGAVGRPGHRDAPAVAYALESVVETLAAWWPAGLPAVRLAGDSGAWTLGAGAPAASLRASDFELLRAVMGRRSRAQLLALDWDADAEPYVDHLHIFGPAATDVVE
jgi:uncharacterized protein (TIGR03083 family)